MGAAEVLKEIENKSEELFLPIVGSKKGSFLGSLVKKKNPKRILEIGTLIGYSSIIMAMNSNSEIKSIEIDKEDAKAARENIRKAGFEAEVIEGNALEVIPNLKGVFDFVFIDAAKKQYLSYIKLLEKHKKIAKGAVIVADNVKKFADAVKDYLKHVRESGMYKSEYHDFIDDGMEVSIRL